MARQWIKMGEITTQGKFIGLLAKSDSLKLNRDVKLIEPACNPAPVATVPGKLSVEGDIEMPLTPEDGIGELLYAFFGQVNTTDNTDGSYSHAFELKPFDIPEFTIIKQVGGVQEKYTGMKVKSINISAKADGDLAFTASLIGKAGELVTGESEVACDLAPPIRVQNAVVEWGNIDVKAGSVEITIERDVDDGGYLLNNDPGLSLIPEGRLSATISIEALLDDATLLQDFLNGADKQLTITLKGVQIPGSTNTFELSFNIPNAVITDREKPTDAGNGLLIEKVEFAAIDEGSGLLTARLVNRIAAYPRT